MKITCRKKLRKGESEQNKAHIAEGRSYVCSVLFINLGNVVCMEILSLQILKIKSLNYLLAVMAAMQ